MNRYNTLGRIKEKEALILSGMTSFVKYYKYSVLQQLDKSTEGRAILLTTTAFSSPTLTARYMYKWTHEILFVSNRGRTIDWLLNVIYLIMKSMF